MEIHIIKMRFLFLSIRRKRIFHKNTPKGCEKLSNHFLSNEELRHMRLSKDQWIIDIEKTTVHNLRTMIIEDIASSIDNMHIN